MTDNNQLPLNEIYLGDCLKLLKKLPDESVDLVVSSPPYNLGKEYEAKQALEIYLQEQTVVLRECSRILKSTGSLFWQIGAFSNQGMLIPLDIRFFPILESVADVSHDASLDSVLSLLNRVTEVSVGSTAERCHIPHFYTVSRSSSSGSV